MLESEPENKELTYTHLTCSLEAQAKTIVHSLQKLLYRVFFDFCCECRYDLLRIVSKLPFMLRVNKFSANNTQVNSIYSSQIEVKRMLTSGTYCLSPVKRLLIRRSGDNTEYQ